MRKFFSLSLAVALGVVFCLLQGCDWSGSGSGGFNTSRAAGVNVNFSGYYRPKTGDYITGSNLTYFVLTQTGNALEVFDNNNSYYTGYVGAPGIQAEPDRTTGAYSAGANLLQAQISFAGVNKASGSQVEFVGIVRAFAMSQVSGQANVYRQTDESVSNQAFAVRNPPVQFGDNLDQVNYNGQYRIDTYVINEGNSWYLLEGSWVEGGVAMAAAARAPAANGSFSLQPQFTQDFDGDVNVNSQTNGSTTLNTGAPGFTPAEEDLPPYDTLAP